MTFNVTAAYDGQGPFKNGMHDAIGAVHSKHNLYRLPKRHTYQSTAAFKKDYASATWHRLLWGLGHLFQRLTGLGHVNPLIPCAGCRHRHDPEHMLTLLSPGLLYCKRCALGATI